MADVSNKRTGKKTARVPVIMQMEALECGAACLTMILAYFGCWMPLEQVRRDCGISRDGSNAKNILKAARSYGLTAQGYRYEPEYLRENGTFPCIIHWNFNHFVVLKGMWGSLCPLKNLTRDLQEYVLYANRVRVLLKAGKKRAFGDLPKKEWKVQEQLWLL